MRSPERNGAGARACFTTSVTRPSGNRAHTNPLHGALRAHERDHYESPSPPFSPYVYMATSPAFCYRTRMAKARFEWDPRKDQENQSKHGVPFAEAQLAFIDPLRVIAEDLSHGATEKRHYCFGLVGEGNMTVRFTYRENAVRIIGAGYWRKGKRIHERENQIHE